MKTYPEFNIDGGIAQSLVKDELVKGKLAGVLADTHKLENINDPGIFTTIMSSMMLYWNSFGSSKQNREFWHNQLLHLIWEKIDLLKGRKYMGMINPNKICIQQTGDKVMIGKQKFSSDLFSFLKNGTNLTNYENQITANTTGASAVKNRLALEVCALDKKIVQGDKNPKLKDALVHLLNIMGALVLFEKEQNMHYQHGERDQDTNDIAQKPLLKEGKTKKIKKAA